MLRFVRQIVSEEQGSDTSMTSTAVNIFNSTVAIEPFDGLMTNFTNDSSAISSLSSTSKQPFFSWQFNWNLILLLGLGLIFVVLLLSVGVWYWCNRVHRVRRRHSLPLAVNDFIETTKTQEKRLSTNPIIHAIVSDKAPPVPPRPTAYTTILGKVEYRSNL